MAFGGTITVPNHPPIRWRAALAIEELIWQVQTEWPGVVVGVIGDTAHVLEGLPTVDYATGRATGGTDHLPDPLGRVCACDLMNSPTFDALAVGLAIAASRDPRLGYMEAENLPAWPGRKHECSPRTRWQFVDVGPSDKAPHLHTSSLHTPALADSRAPWQIKPAPAPTPAPKSEEDDTMVPLDDGATHQSPALPVAWAEGSQVLAAHTAQSPFAAGGVKFGAAWVLDLGHPIKRVAAAPSKRGLWVLFDDLTTTGVVFTSAVSVA